MKKINSEIFIIIVLFFIFVLNGCITNSALTPITHPTIISENWKKYENDNYEISYPENWHQYPDIDISDALYVVISNEELIDKNPINDDQNQNNYGQIKIEVGIHPKEIPEGISLEEWANSNFWNITQIQNLQVIDDSGQAYITADSLSSNQIWVIRLYPKNRKIIYLIVGPKDPENQEIIKNILNTFSIMSK